jgi:hypothetical protein
VALGGTQSEDAANAVLPVATAAEGVRHWNVAEVRIGYDAGSPFRLQHARPLDNQIVDKAMPALLGATPI